MATNKSGIYKAKLNLNYFFCYNETAQDPNISAQAKGVLMYLLSLPEGWRIYVNELHNHFTNGRDGTIKAFNELVEHEYIIKTEIREHGKFKENLYSVYPVKYFDAVKMGIIGDPEQQPQPQQPDEPKEEKAPYKEIIDYLNEKSGKNYRHNTANTIKAINGRWAANYKLEDFKKVIDVKAAEWKGTEWEQYLNPDTLFRPANFEKYLNQKPTHNPKKAPAFNPPKQTGATLTAEERESLLADLEV